MSRHDLNLAINALEELLARSEQDQDRLAAQRGHKRRLLLEGARWQGIRDALSELERINDLADLRDDPRRGANLLRHLSP